MILTGGKRAGKTFILNYLFLLHIAKFRNKNYNFIIAGTTQASIRRNVLNDLEKLLNKELKLKKDGSIKIFGNNVYILEGQNADAYKKARGFTSFGLLMNEATTLHDKFVKEVISRCSGDGARIFMDTNPENPQHLVKVNYIDNDGELLDDERINIKCFHFTLFDNEFLTKDYVNSIVKSTPRGVYYDRDILGLWVAQEGLVYDMWSEENIITKEEYKKKNIIKYFASVDWGYTHFGVICVFAKDENNNIYLIEEHAHKKKNVDKFWVKLALEIKERYGNITFYCDSARPEHIDTFNQNKVKAINADKAVLAGISHTASLIHTKRFKILEDTGELFKKELNLYCWKEGKDEVLKVNDDAADAIRYGLYTEYILYEKNKRNYGKRRS